MTRGKYSVAAFLEAAVCLPHDISIMVRGDHGIGKSEIMRQLAQKYHEREGRTDPFHFIDRRLSQMTEGDIIGLPIVAGDSTRFLPADFIVDACKSGCYLFLDELNRASQGVMASVFQIALDREMNGYKLHPQTRVFTAVNVGDNYVVNDIDLALLDRFWVFDLEPTQKEWLTWARESGVHKMMIDFFTYGNNIKLLDPSNKFEPGDVLPSRRSWARLNRTLQHSGLYSNPTSPLIFTIACGFVGVEAAVAWSSFTKTYQTKITAQDVLFRWPETSVLLSKQNQSDILALISDVKGLLHNESFKLSHDNETNLHSFVSSLGDEMKVHAWSHFIEGATKDLAVRLHRTLHQMILAAVSEHL